MACCGLLTTVRRADRLTDRLFVYPSMPIVFLAQGLPLFLTAHSKSIDQRQVAFIKE